MRKSNNNDSHNNNVEDNNYGRAKNQNNVNQFARNDLSPTMTTLNRRLICRRSTLAHVTMNDGGESDDLAFHSDGEARCSDASVKDKSNFLENVFKALFFSAKHRSSMIGTVDGQLAAIPVVKSSRRVSVRKLLFERINTPPRTLASLGNFSGQSCKNIFDDCEITLSSIYSSRSSSICSGVSSRRDSLNLKKDGTFYRTMWKKLVMDLSRKNCKANNASSKLMYDETPIIGSDATATKALATTWERILRRIEDGQEVDQRDIQSAVKAGVPKHLRGRIWKLLAQQRTVCQVPEYEDLLMEECPFQHAILVDLGRTFPSHPYFGTSFCPGQLSLMYVLKAYAVFDQEIGYCQGLSFVAGMLLLHMEEREAFAMLCHLMYDLNFRDRYRPDMLTLQTEMYIFSRLLFEKQPALHKHIEKYSVPILYTAPWFLTLFANAFPMGFVARVFDFILYTGDVDIVFRIALQLLAVHEQLIDECRSFESIDDFLKNKLPSMSLIQTERIFNAICDMEISREILTYKVEYGVLKDEVYNEEDIVPKGIYNSLFVTSPTFEDELLHAYKKISILQHQKQTLECKLNKAIQMVNRFKTRLGKAVDEKECQLKELFDII